MRSQLKSAISWVLASAAIGVIAPAGAQTVSLGSAAGYALIATDSFTINGPGTINGNVGIGVNGTLTNPAVINGSVLAPVSSAVSGNSTPSLGFIYNPGLLSQVIGDAKSAASNAFGLAATQNLGALNLSSSTPFTINACTGCNDVNVIDVSSIQMSNGGIVLNGSSTSRFIIDDTGDFNSSNSAITLSGGVTANHVLINIGGSLTITGGGPNNLYGTYLDANGSVNVHDKTLTGELIGNSITDTSGFSINPVPFAPVPEADTAWLMLSGLGSLVVIARKRKKA